MRTTVVLKIKLSRTEFNAIAKTIKSVSCVTVQLQNALCSDSARFSNLILTKSDCLVLLHTHRFKVNVA